MIEAFLMAKTLGLKNLWWLAILALIAAAATTAIAIADNAVEDTLHTAEKAGAAKAVVKSHETTLKQAKDANDAESDVERGGDAAVAECVRGARAGTAAGCDRFQ